MELILENIRCFAGRHTIPIKPITFLTGENSSGKSTLLAAMAAANDFGYPLRPRFNKAPYNLGNYDTIATYKGGSYGRAKSFSLGYSLDFESDKRATQIVATYRDRQGFIEVHTLYLSNKSMAALLTFSYERKKTKIRIDLDSNEVHYEFNTEIETDGTQSSWILLDTISFFLGIEGQEYPPQTERVLFDLQRMFNTLVSSPSTSIAPIRTKPSRTYDQAPEEFSPEGEHIPFVLSQVLDDKGNSTLLERFGAEAGLFRHINVKRLGAKISDPVQIMVTGSGRAANLQDVGYGVSQALPIVVESLLVSPERLLLLQQPEVHLHPRAQAALGSLFVDLHAESSKQFVIETHSDYIIDRVRQEIARGRVDADDVQILYFEKQGSETTVFPIAIDKRGNVVDPPPSYRYFFMEEEMNLLSRAKD